MFVDRNTVVACALPTRRQQCHRRIGRQLGCMLLGWLLVPSFALGQTILGAEYDPAADALVIEIAYQGTDPNHDFTLTWDPCRKTGNGGHSVVARLIDRQGKDAAQNEYQVSRRFELSGLQCRPAEVTVRLGPVSNRTVSVPARGR